MDAGWNTWSQRASHFSKQCRNLTRQNLIYMPLTKILVCSGVCFISVTAITAQSVPKNKTLTNVVGYQVHLQKQWSYNQLPKNSIQYRSDPKYIPVRDKKVSTAELHLYPIATPEVKKSFSVPSSALYNGRSYLQSSQFLKYQLQKQKQWHTLQTSPEIDF